MSAPKKTDDKGKKKVTAKKESVAPATKKT